MGVPHGVLFINCPGAGRYSNTSDIYCAAIPKGDRASKIYVKSFRITVLLDLDHCCVNTAMVLDAYDISPGWLPGQINAFT